MIRLVLARARTADRPAVGNRLPEILSVGGLKAYLRPAVSGRMPERRRVARVLCPAPRARSIGLCSRGLLSRAFSRRYPGDVQIEVLPAVGRWDHFASLMVPAKPGGSGCVCMACRNSSLAMPGRIAHMRGLCDSEPGPGVLAFVDGQVAGWCSIAPKATYRALVNSRTIPHVDDAAAWSAICFVVRAGFRRRGLMHDLLDGAVEHAGQRGDRD